jgi:hypothetical protein
MKIPLKTKIFVWYLYRGVILTKNNLAKRNCQDCMKCVFCHEEETMKHLFFNIGLLGLHGQSFRWVLPYTHLVALQTFLENG